MLSYGLSPAPEITEIGAVLETVPFYRALYSAEGDVTSNLTFAPLASTGTIEELKPKAGSIAEYKLYGDGTHSISFSSLFKKNPSSMDFNNTEDVLNLVTFTFDGVDFWYKLTTEPTQQWLELVGDFGYGPDLIVLTGADCTVKDFIYNELPRVRVTAFDILTSVHYTGSDVLTYEISLNQVDWFSNTDPRKAVLELNSTHAGENDVYVRVSDGTLTSLPLETQVTVEISYF